MNAPSPSPSPRKRGEGMPRAAIGVTGPIKRFLVISIESPDVVSYNFQPSHLRCLIWKKKNLIR
jgi:hypothetical protein